MTLIDIPKKEIENLKELIIECEINAIKNNLTSQVWYDTYYKESWITNFEHGEKYEGEENHIKLVMEFEPHKLEDIYDTPDYEWTKTKDPKELLNWYIESDDENAFKCKMQTAIEYFMNYGEPSYSV